MFDLSSSRGSPLSRRIEASSTAAIVLLLLLLLLLATSLLLFPSAVMASCGSCGA